MLIEALKKKGYEVRQSEAAGDPVVSFVIGLKYGKNRRINLENMEFRPGGVTISGETNKIEKE